MQGHGGAGAGAPPLRAALRRRFTGARPRGPLRLGDGHSVAAFKPGDKGTYRGCSWGGCLVPTCAFKVRSKHTGGSTKLCAYELVEPQTLTFAPQRALVFRSQVKAKVLSSLLQSLYYQLVPKPPFFPSFLNSAFPWFVASVV